MRFRRQEGYSLIELMIVVVIIGLLAAMAIPKFMDSTRKAKEAEARALLKGAHNIMWAYIIYHDACPNAGTWDVDTGFGSATGKFYQLAITECAVTNSGPDFLITAVPLVALSGIRSFVINELGVTSEL
jgi:prepilin-type N-terminal cleavage/methylation domain-containing protein